MFITGVLFVSALKNFSASAAVLLDLVQNPKLREIGNNDDLLWNVFLEATLSGT